MDNPNKDDGWVGGYNTSLFSIIGGIAVNLLVFIYIVCLQLIQIL